MTDPEPIDQVPSDVLQQDLPVGGAYDGRLPRVAVPVVPVGIALVRELPSMQAVSGILQGNAGDVMLLCSQSPNRRRILLVQTTGFSRVCTSRQDAVDGNGLRIQNNQPATELHYAGELYVRFTSASSELSYWFEYDVG